MKSSLRKPDQRKSTHGEVCRPFEGDETYGQGCFFDVDDSLTVRSWSSGMERFTHKSAKDVIGMNIAELHPQLSEKIASVLKSGRRRRLRNFGSDCLKGNAFTSEISLTPLRNDMGHISGVHISLEELKGSCPIEQKLMESEKMVEIGKIASSLAHGVRNPLNAIKGAVVYLREKYGREPTLIEFCSIITEEIEKLDTFISDFLSASSRGISPASVNVNGIIESILVMIKPRAEIQKIKVRRHLTVLPLISADAFQIEQALFNLINNAMEAMAQGGRLSIKTSLKWERGREYVLVEISDTGGGIPESKINDIGHLGNDEGRMDRGFGIFLAREVIKSHNGKLLWESVPDRGTTFKIFLPSRQDARL
jgi:two-component system nitrogen regulation sensor histidine kinase GlnL